MTLVGKDEEKAWSLLVSRLTDGNDFWSSKKEESVMIPQKIWFQHFGVQLRDEDLQKDGTLHRGFLIRDRTEAKIAASGFSEFKNDDKEFQVTVDVSQFKHEELEVKMIVDVYIIIRGVHKEKCEDGGECTREFTRRYLLPKGCASMPKDCVYNNGILKITIEKNKTTDLVDSPIKVPISIGDWKDESKESEVNGTSVTTADTKKAPITNDDSEIDPMGEVDPPKVSSGDETETSKGSSGDESEPSKVSSIDESEPSKVSSTDESEPSKVSSTDESEPSKVSSAEEVVPLDDVVVPTKVSPAEEVVPLDDAVVPTKVSPAEEVVPLDDVVVPTKVPHVKSKGSKDQKASS